VPLSPVSGSAGNESASPRGERDAPDVGGHARLRNLSAYTEAGTPRSVGDGGNGQEELLDLIVAATLAQDDPLDDEPADADYWDPDELRGLRRDDALCAPCAPCAPLDGTGPAYPPATGDDPAGASAKGAQSPGWGFASDGPLDELIPGPMLAGLADTAHGSGLRLVNDDELTGIIRAWRRLTSWVTARELAAIAELARRRPADEKTTPGLRLKARLLAARDSTRGKEAGAHTGAAPESSGPESKGSAGTVPVPVDGEPSEPGLEPLRPAEAGRSANEGSGPDAGFPEFIDPFASDELAAALTLTVRAAEAHLEFATDLATKLPMTAAALEAGVIDPVRARIIADATRVLTDEHAALVEELILPNAGQQTSGQLRAALARAILAADPEAARRRREEAQRDARVMRWREDSGTAALDRCPGCGPEDLGASPRAEGCRCRGHDGPVARPRVPGLPVGPEHGPG
jgi:hypothetical protein